MFHFNKYNRFDLIEEQMRKMRDENPKIVTLIEIGKSYENRSLTIVKVSDILNDFNKVIESVIIDDRSWMLSITTDMKKILILLPFHIASP